MITRIIIIACFLLFLQTPAQAQWVETNGPHQEILTYGGEGNCIASIGNDLFAGVSSGAIISTDSGLTWTLTSKGLGGLGVGVLLASSGNLFAGTNGGLFLSSDSGANWNQVPFDTSNSSVTSIVAFGSILMVACGGSNGTFVSTDNGVNWNPVGNDLPPLVISFATMDGKFYAGTKGDGVFLSSDTGESWSWTGGGPMTVNSLVVVGGNLFAATDNGIFLSNGDSGSWVAVNSGLSGSRIYALAASGQNVFAGTFGSGVYLSTNNGTNWNATGNNGLINTYVESLLVSNGNLYVGTDGGGVFLSTDNGADWTVHNPLTLINSSINSLDTIDGNLFACTQMGLFSTTDSGVNWTLDSNGMGNISVSGVVADGGNLFAGTSGDGVFLSTNNGRNWAAANPD